MIQRSVLLGCTEEDARALFHALNIAPQDAVWPDQEPSYLGTSRNGVELNKSRGDFSIFAEITLQDIDEERLFEVFRNFGQQGLLIVIPDEDSENPADSFVFSSDGFAYGYLIEHDEDEGGEFAGHQYISIYPPWKVPEYSKRRFPSPNLAT